MLSLIRKSKRNYYYNFFSNYKNSLRKVWSQINSLTCKKEKHQILSNKKINGKLSSNGKDIANEFNNFFGSIGQELNYNLPKTGIDPRTYLTGNYPLSMAVLPTTHIEVEKIIKSLPNKKCPTEDFSVSIIKQNADLFSPAIKALYNHSINSGIFPDFFKKATIVPIHKTGPFTDVNNYRPISLLNTFGKIFEKLMKSSLINYLNSHNIISKTNLDFSPISIPSMP